MNFPARAESILRGDCSSEQRDDLMGKSISGVPWSTEDDDDDRDDDAAV